MARDSSPRSDLLHPPTGSDPVRPVVMARRGLVSSTHHLASQVGVELMRAGGTAIDAGIGAGVALNVLLPDCCSFGGVAPIILHHAATRQTVTLDGLGVWPALADPGYFTREHGGVLPEGHIRRSVTPGAPDAWMTALERYGSLSLAEVLGPARELADEGVPVATCVARRIREMALPRSGLPPTTAELFAPGGRPLAPGAILRQPALAGLLAALIEEEKLARRAGAGRERAIRRARDLFYRGWIADELCRFQEEQGGWLRADDMAGHQVEVDTPVGTRYGGYEVLACGFWCQGPVLPEALNILEGFDLQALGHNSPAYLHAVLEALNLAFADREYLYGDPRQVEVPAEGLLSKDYATGRAALIQGGKAFGRLPPPGDPWGHQGASRRAARRPVALDRYLAADAIHRGDTAYVAVADDKGNLFSATPSDPALWDAIVPALGTICSGRGSQSRVDPEHLSAIAPGRRPRLTPSPALVMRHGEPLLALGCPGGDVQPQGMLQVLLNMIHFRMNPQEAIEAPRAWSWSYPNSFAPHAYHPGRVEVEGRIAETTRRALAALGHDVRAELAWSERASWVHTVVINPTNGVLVGGSDPRTAGSAVGW
jgi:gamma-glutamyltranspeptidase / glutathione hydrolase